MELKQGNNRFYILDDQKKEIGEVTFSEQGPSVISIDHTFVDPNYRGKHIAQQLIQAVVNLAEKENLSILPVCSYAKVLFERKKEYQHYKYKPL
ncbi:N-acetyltransferase [Sporolactobacillus kofuensis]|nr:GNAT family N-acetyltransferase [Sporolactobacillus kofuensis]MCO7176160.1 N-acetyltransferase [Sporolactobacillus kofuensis]